MQKFYFEVLQMGFGAFIEGLHSATFVIMASLLPTEVTGLLYGAICVKTLNVLVECNILRIENMPTKNRLKLISHLITVGAIVVLSIFDFHGSKIHVREIKECLYLLFLLGVTFAIMEYSLHVISEVVATHNKRKIKVDTWQAIKYIMFIVIFLVTITVFSQWLV